MRFLVLPFVALVFLVGWFVWCLCGVCGVYVCVYARMFLQSLSVWTRLS